MKFIIPLQLLLVCTLLLGVSVFLHYFLKSSPPVAEPFANPAPPTLSTEANDIQLQACPSGTTSYDSKGEIFCCRGDITDGLCNGTTVCSVSSDTVTTPSCLRLLRTQLIDKGKRNCPPSLANYFEDETKKTSGCCSKDRTPDGKGPKVDTPGQRVCKIYDTENKNYHFADSCFNVKRLETMKCPQGSKPDLVVPQKVDHPAYLSCTLVSPSFPVPKVCYIDQPFSEYLTISFPSWKSDLSDNDLLSFCSIANRHYLEKSLTLDEIRRKRTSLLN